MNNPRNSDTNRSRYVTIWKLSYRKRREVYRESLLSANLIIRNNSPLPSLPVCTSAELRGIFLRPLAQRRKAFLDVLYYSFHVFGNDAGAPNRNVPFTNIYLKTTDVVCVRKVNHIRRFVKRLFTAARVAPPTRSVKRFRCLFFKRQPLTVDAFFQLGAYYFVR